MPENTTANATVPEPDKTEGERVDRGQEDIVVDLSHVDLVAGLISGTGVDATPDAKRMSPALDLGVVVVDDIKALADAIDIDSPERTQLFKPNEPPKSNLGKVLVWLRQEFRLIDPNSTIEVGKNRTMYGVHGTPHIGGDTYPVKAEKPSPNSPADSPAKVRVGLIDTMIYRHENFRGRLKFIGRGELQVPLTESFSHLDLHGTFTVGLILDQAPDAEVVVKAELRHELAKSTVWEVAVAMAEFVDQEVQLVVLPLLCVTDDDDAPLVLQRAVTLLHRHGIPAIAAAGNHGEPRRSFPAACAGAVAVGAAAESGTVQANFNPQQAGDPWISLAGPGVGVVSTSVDGTVKYVEIPDAPVPLPPNEHFQGGAKWSGTSFATATVGGVVAAKLANGEGSAFEIIEKLKTQSPADHNGVGSYGKLDH